MFYIMLFNDFIMYSKYILHGLNVIQVTICVEYK